MAQPRIVNLEEQARVGSCTTEILADGAVTSEKLATDAVTNISILDGTITASKFASAVFGEGLVYNSFTNAIDVNIDLANLEITADMLEIKPGGVHTIHLDIDADLDFHNNQSLNFRLENLVSNPAPGNSGRLIWRTDLNEILVDNGVSFIPLSSLNGHLIEDEGISLTQRPTINFIGAGVTVTDSGGKTQVDIPSSVGTYFVDEVTVSNTITDHTIVLSQTPIPNSTIVSWNGIVLRLGASFDYTISGNIITLDPGIILTVGDGLQIVYPS
jgi:hypothetical protein